MNATARGLAEWHALATAPDPERLARPVVHTRQEGRQLVVAYLSAAAATLGQGQFRYVRELVDGRDAMLEFTCILDDIHVNGVDIIRFDEAGKIADFKVMIRPIKAVNKVWEMMAAQLEKTSAS